jgi:hypothetical protein
MAQVVYRPNWRKASITAQNHAADLQIGAKSEECGRDPVIG